MDKKKSNLFVKILVVLGSLAAIFLALTVVYKKYNRKLRAAEKDSLDFNEEDYDIDFGEYLDELEDLETLEDDDNDDEDDVLEF